MSPLAVEPYVTCISHIGTVCMYLVASPVTGRICTVWHCTYLDLSTRRKPVSWCQTFREHPDRHRPHIRSWSLVVVPRVSKITNELRGSGQGVDQGSLQNFSCRVCEWISEPIISADLRKHNLLAILWLHKWKILLRLQLSRLLSLIWWVLRLGDRLTKVEIQERCWRTFDVYRNPRMDSC